MTLACKCWGRRRTRLRKSRLEHEEPGVSGSILEGLEEILTVIRLGLPHELRRSLACTNIVENALPGPQGPAPV